MTQRKNGITEKSAHNSHQTVQATWVTLAVEWVFKILPIGIYFLLLSTNSIIAQYTPREMSLKAGERINYDIYFKWGILMPRAGEANFAFHSSSYKGSSAYRYRLTFQTSKFFDSIFKMRDTIDCYYQPDYTLLHSSKRTNEGDYYLIEELTFNYNNKQTNIRSHRYTLTEKKIDTLLKVNSGYVFDMLGATLFLRTLDWGSLKKGDQFPLIVTMGRDLIKTSFNYQGQAIIEHSGSKYRTHHFTIDIHDDAFSQKKSAAELWVGDDENHIPIKIRSKLKIGYAEVYYKSSSQIKGPLKCRIEKK